MTTHPDALRRVAHAGIGAPRDAEPGDALLLCWAGALAGYLERLRVPAIDLDGLPTAERRPWMRREGEDGSGVT